MINLLCLLLALAPFLPVKARWRGTFAFVSIGGLLLLGKYLSFGSTYVPADEAQLLTQAKLLGKGALPWVDWDPTTSGPLNSLWPNLLNFLTGTPTLLGARLSAFLLQWLTLVFLYRTLRLMGSHAFAWALTLPALYSLTLNGFSTLSGVHTGVLPGLLFVMSAYFYERSKEAEHKTPYTFSLLLAGAQLMTKIQAAPAALAFAAMTMIRRKRFSLSGALAFGASSIFIVIGVSLAGGLTDFWHSYVTGNLHYGKGLSLFAPGLSRAILESAQFPLLMTLLFVTLLSLRGKNLLNPYLIQFVVLGLSLLPSRAFLLHYFDVILFPMILMAASLGVNHLQRKKILTAFVVTLIGLSAIWELRLPKQKVFPARQFVSKAVEKFIPPWRPAEIAIWGWMPEVYVLTETLPGTRDAIAQFAIYPHPRQDYYVDRFIKDLETRRPLWVLEVACRERQLWGRCDLSHYPKMQKFLKENYEWMEFYENPVPNTSGLWKRK